MNLHDFYYDLPEELIAQDPLADRSSSKLMVLDKKTGRTEHRIFKDIIEYLNPGDCLVINDTKVIPARLIGEKEGTGAAIEVLLLKRKEDMANTWEVLVKPGKKARPGTRISFGDGKLVGEIIDIVEELKREGDFLKIIYNIPSGFKLTAKMTTNYRQLKTIYDQRKCHRLPEWRGVCEWIESLPYMKEFLIHKN